MKIDEWNNYNQYNTNLYNILVHKEDANKIKKNKTNINMKEIISIITQSNPGVKVPPELGKSQNREWKACKVRIENRT